MTRTDHRCIKIALCTQQFVKSVTNQECKNIATCTAHLTTFRSSLQPVPAGVQKAIRLGIDKAAVNTLIRSQCINTFIFSFRCAKKYKDWKSSR